MSETGFPSPAALRSGEAELIAHVQTVCDRIDAEDPLIQALLPEPARRQRLTREAEALLASFPDSAAAALSVRAACGREGLLSRGRFPH